MSWFVFMVMLVDNSDVLIEAEDRAGEQERLGHVVEQPACHVVDMDHLVGHECDTAHYEQHRTGVLRDFEASVVFHGIVILTSYIFLLTSYISVASPAAPRMAAMM